MTENGSEAVGASGEWLWRRKPIEVLTPAIPPTAQILRQLASIHIGQGTRFISNQFEGARALLILWAMSPAKYLEARIRADLKLAMVGRRTIEVHALRSLLGVIDDAQAVQVGGRHDKYVVWAFGDAGVEVPRLDLSADALETLLRREQAERAQLAGQMSALGQDNCAMALKEEATIIARYLARTDRHSGFPNGMMCDS